jgi:hypothetical protein
MASIEELIAALAKQSSSFAAPKKLAPIKYKSSSYKKLNLTPYNFSAKDFTSLVDKKGSKKSSSFLGTLGDILSGTLGQPSGAITNTLYNAIKHTTSKDESTTEKIMHLLPTSLLAETVTQGLKNGGKEQWKDWTDGKFSAGDIPLVGALHGMDKGWKRGEDILGDEAGVDNKFAKIAGGIGIDIALDPLTYLTGGLSAATKLGKAAELAKIAELSKGLGIGGKFKNSAKFLETAQNAMKAGMISKYTDAGTGALKVSEKLIDKTVSKKIAEMADAIKTARNTTYNSHVNDWGFAVPFTNKFGKVGTYGKGNLLHNSEATVGAQLVDDLLKEVSNKNATHLKQLQSLVKARYGVEHNGELTKTMFDDLHGLLQPFKSSNIKGLPDSVGKAGKEADLTAHQDYDFNEAIDMLGKKNRTKNVKTEPNILFHGTNKAGSITKNGFKIGKHTEYGDNVFGNGGIYLGHDLKDAWYLGSDSRMPDYKSILGVHATPKNTLVLKNDKQLASLLEKYKLGEWDLDKLAEKLKAEGYDAIQVKVKTPDFNPNVHGSYSDWTKQAEKNGDYNLIDKTGGNQVFVMDEAALKSLGSIGKKGRESKDSKAVIDALKKKHGLTETIEKANPLDNVKVPTVKDPTKALDKFKQTYKTEWEHFMKGNPEKIDPLKAKEFYKKLAEVSKGKFNEMGNFKSNFEHALDKVNPFDARTLATGDKFTNSMGDHIADANSQRVGETARYTKALDDVESFLKKQNLDEAGKKQLMEHAIYILEKHAPDSLGGDKWIPSRAAQQLANKLRPVIDRVGSEEQKAGVLDGLRKNYFPHVVNKDESAWKEIEDFNKRHPELSSLKGVSSKSKFNNERKSFQTLAQRDNYIAKIEKAISKATDQNEIDSLRAQQERVAKMFDTDVVSALTRRVKEGVRAKAMKEMQTKLSKYGMMKTIEKGSKETPPTGLEKLDPAEAKRLGLGEGNHYVHPEVLKGMKRVDEIFTADGMKKWQRHLTAFADAWRPLVTYYKLSHYRNNIIGNVINNMAAGVKAADYKVAMKLVMGYKSGKLNESQMKIIEAAFKHNVISGGFLYDAHATFEHAKPNTLEKIGKALGQNQAIKKVRHHLGETPDDISRMANFINGINKWGNTERAAKQVRTYLFNYNELTNADRQMRVLVPFWNWTKRNIPLQMKLLMENPKFAMNIERFKDLFNEGQKGQDWQKESGVKVPKTDYYTTLPSPTNDLSQLLHPVQFAGSMNPLPKSVIELMTNRKLFTGAPISYGSNNVQAKDVPAYAASNLGILGDLYKLLDGQRSPAESAVNSINPITAIK